MIKKRLKRNLKYICARKKKKKTKRKEGAEISPSKPYSPPSNLSCVQFL